MLVRRLALDCCSRERDLASLHVLLRLGDILASDLVILLLGHELVDRQVAQALVVEGGTLGAKGVLLLVLACDRIEGRLVRWYFK